MEANVSKPSGSAQTWHSLQIQHARNLHVVGHRAKGGWASNWCQPNGSNKLHPSKFPTAAIQAAIGIKVTDSNFGDADTTLIEVMARMASSVSCYRNWTPSLQSRLTPETCKPNSTLYGKNFCLLFTTKLEWFCGSVY